MAKSMDVKILLIALSLMIGSCGKDCLFTIASDQLRFADSIELNNNTYYLYTLTTGWNDKAVYFQLYDKQPTLNDCKEIDIEPIYEIVYDDYPKVRYVKKMTLQPGDLEKLKITYTSNKDEGFAGVYDVKFTR